MCDNWRPSSTAPPVSFRRGVESIGSSLAPPRSSSPSTLALLHLHARPPDRGRCSPIRWSFGQPLPLYPRSPVWSESLLPPPAGSQSHSRMDVGSPGQAVFPGTWGGARAGQGPSRGRSSGEHAQQGGRRHASFLTRPPTPERLPCHWREENGGIWNEIDEKDLERNL